jgi:hypothetical protein
VWCKKKRSESITEISLSKGAKAEKKVGNEIISTNTSGQILA